MMKMMKMIMRIPIEVTVLSKVIAHGDDVHNEQHPDPPCDEHITFNDGVLEHDFAPVVGIAPVPIYLVIVESQFVMHVNGAVPKAASPSHFMMLISK